MISSSYRCIEQISEARRLYDQGLHLESMAIVESIRHCARQCSEESACSAALRIVSKGMRLEKVVG